MTVQVRPKGMLLITTGAAVVSVEKVPVNPVPQSYDPLNVMLVPPVYAPVGASTTLLICSEPTAIWLVAVHVAFADVAVDALSGSVTVPPVTGSVVPPAVRHTQSPTCT